MDAEIKTKWVEALRSGKYEQGRKRLRDGDTFCCLGVLCDAAKLGEWRSDKEYGEDRDYVAFHRDDLTADDVLPTQVLDRIGLSREAQDVCWKMNDNDKKTFAEIADFIEQNV